MDNMKVPSIDEQLASLEAFVKKSKRKFRIWLVALIANGAAIILGALYIHPGLGLVAVGVILGIFSHINITAIDNALANTERTLLLVKQLPPGTLAEQPKVKTYEPDGYA